MGLKLFFGTKEARTVALTQLEPEMKAEAELYGDKQIKLIDNYPGSHGLFLPERVMRVVYIDRQDISFLVGWETGRQSEPAFMDMNLHAVCGDSEPRVVLFQADSENPLNPHALLIAYA